MKFTPSHRKHGWFYKKNPFNAMLRNRLFNTLADSALTPQTYTSPVLDQGENPYCAEYATAATRAAITGKTYDPLMILGSVLNYLNELITRYQGCDFKTGMAVGVNPGFAPNDSYAAILYIYPVSGVKFADTLNSYVQMYKRPVNGGIEWYQEYFGGQGGVIPFSGKTGIGGHFIMVCGKISQGYTDNQGSWGVNAPGSIGGHYLFSDDIIESDWRDYPFGVGIDSTDRTTIILGQMSALYIHVLDLLGSLGNTLTSW
jgi:hypothetical protein